MVRTLILTHRYVGIVTCLLFAMWFGSGMVMMYVGFPELTAEERLRGLTPLDLSAAPVLPSQALAAAGVEGWPRALRMEMVLGRPAYIVHPWEGQCARCLPTTARCSSTLSRPTRWQRPNTWSSHAGTVSGPDRI